MIDKDQYIAISAKIDDGIVSVKELAPYNVFSNEYRTKYPPRDGLADAKKRIMPEEAFVLTWATLKPGIVVRKTKLWPLFTTGCSGNRNYIGQGICCAISL